MEGTKRMYRVIALSISLILCAAGNLSWGQEQKIIPEKHVAGSHVIRIKTHRGIIPPTLSIKPGSTVIWVNESDSLIEILFPHKKITLSCQNPVNFIIDVDGSFVSNKIGVGAVASICFIEKGEFEYIVKKLSPGKSSPEDEFKGNVIIEK